MARRDPWTIGQQRKYRAICARLGRAAGLDDEARRDVIRDLFGVDSTSRLNRRQMDGLIAEMELRAKAWGVAAQAPRPRFDISDDAVRAVGCRPENDQERYMARVAQRLGWGGSPERLAGFVRRVFPRWAGTIQGLPRRAKSNVINGLRALLRDQAAHKARCEREPGERSQHPTGAGLRFVAGDRLRPVNKT